MTNLSEFSLSGKLMAALPVVCDEPFNRSVVYVHQHDDIGAYGFILNKRFPVQNAVSIAKSLGIQDYHNIYYGGPISPNTGIIFHTPDYDNGMTVDVCDGVCMSAGMEILKNIRQGTGPSKYMIMLGFCEWASEQIDDEVVGTAKSDYRPFWAFTKATEEHFFSISQTIPIWQGVIAQAAADRCAILLGD
jgi:putative transcriptional regulator